MYKNFNSGLQLYKLIQSVILHIDSSAGSVSALPWCSLLVKVPVPAEVPMLVKIGILLYFVSVGPFTDFYYTSTSNVGAPLIFLCNLFSNSVN